jgi:hypothetical protein
MCSIVNHVWTFFTKTIYFFVAILSTNICFHIIFKNFDQNLILLLLLCGNLEKESLNCPEKVVQFFIYL